MSESPRPLEDRAPTTDGPQDDVRSLIEALQTVNGGSLSIAQNLNDFFTHVGREAEPLWFPS